MLTIRHSRQYYRMERFRTYLSANIVKFDKRIQKLQFLKWTWLPSPYWIPSLNQEPCVNSFCCECYFDFISVHRLNVTARFRILQFGEISASAWVLWSSIHHQIGLLIGFGLNIQMAFPCAIPLIIIHLIWTIQRCNRSRRLDGAQMSKNKVGKRRKGKEGTNFG